MMDIKGHQNRYYDVYPHQKYCLEFKDMQKIFQLQSETEEELTEMFKKLHPFIVHPIHNPQKISKKEVKLTKTTKRKFYALFEKKGEYQYFRLCIKPSGIEGGGMGVYALEDIHKGWSAQYVGEAIKGENCNPYYSFTIQPFRKRDGEPDYSRDPYMYIDSTSEKNSNWTRTINCRIKEEENNMEPEQKYDQIWCKTKRLIESGEELFLWYGEDYVKENF